MIVGLVLFRSERTRRSSSSKDLSSFHYFMDFRELDLASNIWDRVEVIPR